MGTQTDRVSQRDRQTKHMQTVIQTDRQTKSVVLIENFSVRSCCGLLHKYIFSERQTCVDRHIDCGSVLLDLPETCTTHLDFARLQCPYSCGLCRPDTSELYRGVDYKLFPLARGTIHIPRNALHCFSHIFSLKFVTVLHTV